MPAYNVEMAKIEFVQKKMLGSNSIQSWRKRTEENDSEASSGTTFSKLGVLQLVAIFGLNHGVRLSMQDRQSKYDKRSRLVLAYYK